MSVGKILSLIIITVVLASSVYAYVKQREVSPLLSAYVQQRYAKQLEDNKIKSMVIVDVFGEGKVGVLESDFANFRYWISSNSHDEKYTVNKAHKSLLVGIGINRIKGKYEVLLPRSATQLSDEQLKAYIDNISVLRIRLAQSNNIGMRQPG